MDSVDGWTVDRMEHGACFKTTYYGMPVCNMPHQVEVTGDGGGWVID